MLEARSAHVEKQYNAGSGGTIESAGKPGEKSGVTRFVPGEHHDKQRSGAW